MCGLFCYVLWLLFSGFGGVFLFEIPWEIKHILYKSFLISRSRFKSRFFSFSDLIHGD